jgi:hypothetical protein
MACETRWQFRNNTASEFKGHGRPVKLQVGERQGLAASGAAVSGRGPLRPPRLAAAPARPDRFR